MGFSMTPKEKQKILNQNLREFEKRRDLADQQKALTALELAQLYCEQHTDAINIYDIPSALSSDFSVNDEIVFLSEICRSSLAEQIKASLFIGSSEPTSAGAHSKISYLKNRYNDIAFEHFSHTVANAKPDYASSFAECCESVFDGRCEYCILPIMNSSDGRLMSFYSLLDRYELKICATVDIDKDDSSISFKHALIGRSCKEQRQRAQRTQRYIFEFSLISEGTEFFAPLLEAANRLGAKLSSIDSLPVEYTPDTQKFFFSFSLPSQGALAFRLFVALKHQTYTPIGFYKETN